VSHETGHPTNGEPEQRRREELRRLVEIYSIRTRELSEAVAILGWYIVSDNRFQQTILEIKRLRVLCDKAWSDLLAWIEQNEPPSGTRGSS
jgi:hypothetical protein